ncbi:MAG: C4-dicarboxylate ABC transporter substrate-binding protein [Rubrivivax sp. SCN 71-131]|mgnify:CR=1 FL=1|nr:MAG: C4-dicarboxylate ABC transporter substrate-binding protein [Rubrivivax sp. SCN 71-131]
MKRMLTGVLVGAALCLAGPLAAQTTTRLAIGTGGTGGVYYPLGGGMASILSKHVKGWEATAEVTGASVANLQLIGQGKQDFGFTMADSAYDATQGTGKFKSHPVEARTLMVLYPNKMQAVTVAGSGIETLADFKGKRISTGEPNSGTEVMALRLLEAAGIAKDVSRERLSVAEGVNAIKDRKIDGLIWVGGVPTAALTDLAATPGLTIKLLDHAQYADALNKKWGPLYVKGSVAAGSYKGQDKDVGNIDVWNLLVADKKMSDDMAYTIVKTLMEHKDELVAVHREAKNITLEAQAAGSPIPMHPGARKYFEERGVKFPN